MEGRGGPASVIQEGTNREIPEGRGGLTHVIQEGVNRAIPEGRTSFCDTGGGEWGDTGRGGEGQLMRYRRG